MKKTLNVAKGLVLIERAIQECGQVADLPTKIAVGLAHNLKVIREPLASVREAFKNTPEIDAFGRAVQEYREKNATKTEPEIQEGIAALKLKHKKAQDDLDDLRRRDQEGGQLNFEVDLYRIPLAHLPGWFADDVEDPEAIEEKNATTSKIPFSSLQVLIEHGIFYDPAVEDRDGNPVTADQAEPEEKSSGPRMGGVVSKLPKKAK